MNPKAMVELALMLACLGMVVLGFLMMVGII